MLLCGRRVKENRCRGEEDCRGDVAAGSDSREHGADSIQKRRVVEARKGREETRTRSDGETHMCFFFKQFLQESDEARTLYPWSNIHSSLL
jgi:hypothetical protein